MRSPMTRPNRHRIQRQIVELADRRQRARARLRTRNWPARSGIAPFRSWNRCSIAPPVRTNCCGSTAWNSISGAIGGADWPAEFRRKLVAELTRSLAQFTAVSEADDRTARARSAADASRGGSSCSFCLTAACRGGPRRPAGGWSDVLIDGIRAGWNALREDVACRSSRARRGSCTRSATSSSIRAIREWSGVPRRRSSAGALEAGARSSAMRVNGGGAGSGWCARLGGARADFARRAAGRSSCAT